MRRLAFMAFTTIALVVANGNALAQSTANLSPFTTLSTKPLFLDDVAGEKDWSFSLSAYAYLIPDSRDYIQPTFTADRDWLHLEARYNYEDLDTASIWAGYNFSGGEELAWEITPMLGGVFGDTSGVAIGYKGSLSWWKLELYSEGEYVFDADDMSDSFFYTWTELTLSPIDGFRIGLVGQRTRAYEADRDIQPGLLIGFSWEKFDIAGYVLNPDDSDRIFIVSFGVSF